MIKIVSAELQGILIIPDIEKLLETPIGAVYSDVSWHDLLTMRGPGVPARKTHS
jgi:hypothetical protein